MNEFVKTACKTINEYIKTETRGEGRINFAIFIVLALLTGLICIPVFLAYLIKLAYPNSDIMMPWYAVLAFFAISAGYGIYCANKVMAINEKRDMANKISLIDKE